MYLKFLAYAVLGRVAIFFLQRFPVAKLPIVGKYFAEDGALYELWSCDLCLGWYVFTLFAFMMQIDLMEGWFAYLPLVSEGLTGAITSLIVHLVRVGWQTNYSETVIKVE